MMRFIVLSSLRYRFLVIAAAASMMIIGVSQLRDMPVDVFPEFAPPRVEVQTIALGLSAGDVEGLVTVPLEQGLAGLEGLDIMRSKSVPDLSSIELIFERGQACGVVGEVPRVSTELRSGIFELDERLADLCRRRSEARIEPGCVLYRRGDAR